MTTTTRPTRRSRFAAWSFVAALGLVIIGGVVASPVRAQGPPNPPPCSAPYGCPPTTPPGQGDGPSCSIEPRRGPPGTQVTATVSGVEPPAANVDILFDGALVGSGAAVAGTAEITFTVPSDASNGSHSVTAVAPNGSTGCGPGNSGFVVTGGGTEVLGEQTSRGGTSSSSGQGNLARTGLTILGLLLIAAVLFVVGRALVEQSRRRRPARSG